MTDVRLAESLVALSLAGDLGHGMPLEHGLRATYLASRLAERLGLDGATRRDVFYVTLLQATGCVGNAHAVAAFLHTDDIAFKRDIAAANYGSAAGQLRVVAAHAGRTRSAPARIGTVARAVLSPGVPREATRAHCELAALLAERVGLGTSIGAGLRAVYEHWDGGGLPDGRRGVSIGIAARVAQVAIAADVFAGSAGPTAATSRVASLSGQAFDPQVADAFAILARGGSVWRALESPSLPDDVLALEPAALRTYLDEAGLDAVALACADFADLKSPWFVGHSRGVAALAEAAALALRLPPADVTFIRRAGLLHDLGRASVSNAILDAPRALSNADRETIRLHAYYTERLLDRAPALASFARVCGMHHERLDGSGYHRGARAGDLSMAGRVIAVADVAQAISEVRPYRPAFAQAVRVSLLRDEARRGALDADVVEALIGSAMGNGRAQRRPPDAITSRELEVLRLVAVGHPNREIAQLLEISGNTVRHHLESIYGKLGVTTRVGAVMRGLERGYL